MRNKSTSICFVVMLLLIMAGCSSSVKPSSALRQVSLGMSKNEVVNALGEPSVVRGAIKNKFNQVVEVWEYTLALPSKDSTGQVVGKSVFTFMTLGMGAASFKSERKDYWLYFLNGHLAQWGEADDWGKEPERIYEFNFNPSPALTR